MPKPKAYIDYQICDPRNCEAGECRAVLLCSLGILKQPEAFAPPEPDQRMCLGCGACAQACEAGAVRIF